MNGDITCLKLCRISSSRASRSPCCNRSRHRASSASSSGWGKAFFAGAEEAQMWGVAKRAYRHRPWRQSNQSAGCVGHRRGYGSRNGGAKLWVSTFAAKASLFDRAVHTSRRIGSQLHLFIWLKGIDSFNKANGADRNQIVLFLRCALKVSTFAAKASLFDRAGKTSAGVALWLEPIGSFSDTSHLCFFCARKCIKISFSTHRAA